MENTLLTKIDYTALERIYKTFHNVIMRGAIHAC
jgi:hypothetical protein